MPGTLQLVQVGKSPIRIQTFLVTNDEFMLVNPDIVNQIFIGNDPGSQPIAVPPLGSVTLDAKKHDIWVSTSGGNYLVNAYLMPNGSNWVPSPAQVAASINALGLAKDSTVNTVATNTTGAAKDATVQTTNTISANTNTILGSPAQTTDINGVVTTLGTPAQKSDVNQVNSTLGVPSQSQDVKNLTTGGNPGGIPVLRGTDNLGNATNASIAAGATITLLNSVTLTKPGFEAVFKLNLPASSGTVPFAILTLNWQDSITGLQVGLKSYVLTQGSGATGITVYLSGPCRGNQLTMTMQNAEPAFISTLTWAFNQTSHTYLTDRLLQPAYSSSVNGFFNCAGNPSRGVLAQFTSAISANASTSRLVAACNAQVLISIDNTVQLNACAVQLNTPSSTALYGEQAAPATLIKVTAAIGAQANQLWNLPNGATVMQVFNQGATNTITPNIAIIIKEY